MQIIGLIALIVKLNNVKNVKYHHIILEKHVNSSKNMLNHCKI
jgi:hypothetical protein